jgi:hypothetical protein
MAGIGLLHGVHCQRAYRVAQLDAGVHAKVKGSA